MSQATSWRQTAPGGKVILAFLFGVGIGLSMVAPVLPRTIGLLTRDLMTGGGRVILVGIAALGILMIILLVLYRTYLRG